MEGRGGDQRSHGVARNIHVDFKVIAGDRVDNHLVVAASEIGGEKRHYKIEEIGGERRHYKMEGRWRAENARR